MTATVLVLDLGTSSCKGALYTRRGERIASAACPYPLAQPRPHFVEQDPAAYVAAARQVVQQLMVSAAAPVLAIGFSTQTPTLVLLDETCSPVAPAIVWQDSRAGEQSAQLMNIGHRDRSQWFGMELPVGAATTPSKLLWLRDCAPEIWQRTRWVVQPKDYVAAILTGELATDAWCAKGIAHLETGLMHEEWREYLGKRETLCPPVLSIRAVTGSVRSADWGIPAGVPVITGWSDAMAAILSTGAMHAKRRGFVLTGTSEIIGISRTSNVVSKGLFLVPPFVLETGSLSLHYGPTQAGGSCLEWIANILGRTPAEALSLASQRDGLSDIICRPYWQGERAPYWDHTLTASFRGLRNSHGAPDLVRAVMQGVALQERLVLERAEQSEPATEVVLAGGAARDESWNQLRADILQRPVALMNDTEASLRGAAMLAWSALDQPLDESAGTWMDSRPMQPRREFAELAASLFQQFIRPDQ